MNNTANSETVDFYELLAKLRDFHSGIADALDKYVQTKVKAVVAEPDPEKLVWVNSEGPKGPFQFSNDAENPEYKALRKDLEDHKGTLTRSGLFYWVFTNGSTIGRKERAY